MPCSAVQVLPCDAPRLRKFCARRPVAHLINFKFVPVQQRILYINCVQVSAAQA